MKHRYDTNEDQEELASELRKRIMFRHKISSEMYLKCVLQAQELVSLIPEKPLNEKEKRCVYFGMLVYKHNKSVKEIAKEHEISETTVRRDLKQLKEVDPDLYKLVCDTMEVKRCTKKFKNLKKNTVNLSANYPQKVM
jgi:DNA-binding CsgD family transcriptional regulator